MSARVLVALLMTLTVSARALAQGASEPPTNAPSADAAPADAAPADAAPDDAAPDDAAQPDRLPSEGPTDALAFDLTAGTHFPVALGVDAQLEIPYRILFALHLGWMPPAYVEVINAVSTAAGWYDATTAALISAALEGAFVLRLSAGFRPFEEEGFEVLAGYTLIAAGGSVTSAEAIEAGTGRQIDRDGRVAVPMHATLHALHAVVGWRFVIEEHLVIRAQLGWVHTVASETVIEAGRDREGGPVDQAEDYLDGILQSYGFTPEVRLLAGYRF